MSSSSGPVSSSTFLRFVGGRLGEELSDRLRPPFGTAGGNERWEQNNVLPKGSRSAVEKLSDSGGRVSHSLMVQVARAAAVGTSGGAGR
jgi:hypothetical protein